MKQQYYDTGLDKRLKELENLERLRNFILNQQINFVKNSIYPPYQAYQDEL